MTNDHATEMLSYRDAAALLGLSLNTVYSMVRRKQIPHVRLGKRLVRFPLDALRAWLDERLIRPPAAKPPISPAKPPPAQPLVRAARVRMPAPGRNARD